ncbi:PREDICTED: zinc finger CCCH domain-containing protein 3-like [Tarenaya hassleriana]|uniref:zinc finger CCCH domain-containing protein 3-like n=1 Tax=Tarenaya hassleriana TaxID=28532 RepID=UPI00053C2796|nr:PREDICTED: zinc finger CCCH domain-containing protein 3-like [Tarenaya hassleriana]
MRPMSETQHDQSSIGSNRSSEKIEDSFRRIKLNGEGDVQSGLYPDRPGQRDCPFYLRTGLCGYGNNCRYNHPPYVSQAVIYYKDDLPERVGQPDCEYFLKTGTCKYGHTCKYHHPKDRNGAGPVLFNVLGFPMRQGEKSCPYYLRTGTCRFGVACKFHHPQPVNGPSAAYGVSSYSSVGLPYLGGMTMVSMPPATYGAVPRAQVPQAYVPVMVSPSHGILPPQGWTTYTAAPNQIYNVKDQPDSSSSASVPVAVTSNQGLAGRLDQPECRYFMSTGTCKYGDDCKYNHPKERNSQSPQNLLSPVVLPSRPGQPACTNFMAYGFCKFGPNCKFDHSLPPYPYNMALTMSPSPATYASPVSTRLRISPPNGSDSPPLSEVKPAETNQSSEAEKPGINPEHVNSEVEVSSENSALTNDHQHQNQQCGGISD